jgi:hypothetical protein
MPRKRPRRYDSLWAYFAPPGVSTQWYWPAGTRGKPWNFFHGHGWRIA